jgi:hypothetical protein
VGVPHVTRDADGRSSREYRTEQNRELLVTTHRLTPTFQ